MLTATYSLVAIAAEHDAARRVLLKFQQYIRNIWHGIQKMDLAFFDTAFDKLAGIDEYCRNRKIELYVIPTLRKATREADMLLDELNMLSESAGRILCSARARLSNAWSSSTSSLHDICLAMELYCDHLSARLKKEEEELFPLMRRVLSVDEWFAIAAQFLSEDAEAEGRRRHALSRLPSPAAAPVANLTAV